jgi:hypothetical protein
MCGCKVLCVSSVKLSSCAGDLLRVFMQSAGQQTSHLSCYVPVKTLNFCRIFVLVMLAHVTRVMCCSSLEPEDRARVSESERVSE